MFVVNVCCKCLTKMFDFFRDMPLWQFVLVHCSSALSRWAHFLLTWSSWSATIPRALATQQSKVQTLSWWQFFRSFKSASSSCFRDWTLSLFRWSIGKSFLIILYFAVIPNTNFAKIVCSTIGRNRLMYFGDFQPFLRYRIIFKRNSFLKKENSPNERYMTFYHIGIDNLSLLS